jgi:hypothetical protein
MTRTMRLGMLVSLICFASSAQVYAATGAQYGTPQSGCTGDPPNNTAYLWTDTYYGGTCYMINVDNYSDTWASWDASTGFPNDSIKSVKIGGTASLVLFWNSFNTSDNGATFMIPGPQCTSGQCPSLGSWNNQVSAARIQTFSSCLSSSAKLALFTDANWGGDCTLLPFPNNYFNPVAMGFRNDTTTGVLNSSSQSVGCICDNVNCGLPLITIDANYSYPDLSTIGWNDRGSAVRLQSQCWR